jgi:Bacterial Ig-like domain (group 3)
MNGLKRWFGTQPSARASRRFHSTRLQVEPLEDRRVPTVSFFGGNLLPHVQTQALFLGTDSSALASADPAILNAFLKDLIGGPYLQALQNAGYHVGTGSAVAGALDRTSLTTGSTISDAFIRARLQADISSGLLQAPNADTLYVVYVDPNVAVNLGGGRGTTQQGILGYHTAFVAANGAAIRYAVVVAPGGPAHNSVLSEATTTLDQLTAVTSHEVAEAVTDPDINSNVNNGRLGWIDPQRGEIADIEENNPSVYVRLPDGHLVQEVADRNDQLLSIFLPPVGPPSNLIGTTTTLQGRVNPSSLFGVPTVTFTVIVTPSSGTVEPGGTVNLLVNGTVLSSAAVQVINGVAEATFTVGFFGPGVFTFTAQYLGSSQFQGSTSNPVVVDVS